MEKETKKQPSIINQDLIMIWVFAGALGFVAYAYFSFHTIGSWIWMNIVYSNQPDNVLIVQNNISIFYLICWFILFFGIYFIIFALLVMLPSYLYTKHKIETEKEVE